MGFFMNYSPLSPNPHWLDDLSDTSQGISQIVILFYWHFLACVDCCHSVSVSDGVFSCILYRILIV